MSRIGRLPIPVPGGVKVDVTTDLVTVTGPRGTLSQPLLPEVQVDVDSQAGEIKVIRKAEDRRHRAVHGLARTLVSNMVEGVTKGFTRTLDLVGVGYRGAMSKEGGLTLQLGYSQPRIILPVPGVELKMEGTTKIVITGNDKQQVGQVAADIRALRPPEPYKGKGIRYTEERVHRKVGKAGKV